MMKVWNILHAWGRSEMLIVSGWNGNGSQRNKLRVEWIHLAQDNSDGLL